MTSILLLGNSHLSAIKLAYDDLKSVAMPQCSFFCARGGDLAFTEVVDGKIKSVPTADPSEEDLLFFFPEGAKHYKESKRPLDGVDVAEQFRVTGGATEINLADVDAVFYVAGISPYDFKRLGDESTPMSVSLRNILLRYMLQDKFLLRQQIEAMKLYKPQCRHFFIGMPLAASEHCNNNLTAEQKNVIKINRDIVRSLAHKFLFDDVFMPSENLLDETLLYTKSDYRIGGRQESELFQGENPTQSDLEHMNQAYGKEVFLNFILPIARRLGQRRKKESGLRARFGVYFRGSSHAG